MKKILFVLFFIIMMMITGCGTLPTTTDVCSTTTEPSFLCEMASKNDVKLEQIGMTLVLVNAVAIGEGAYSREDAVKVLKSIRDNIEYPVSYMFFRDEIKWRLEKYPGLFIAAEIYLNQMDSTKIMYPFDRAILQSWLDTQIRSLEQ